MATRTSADRQRQQGGASAVELDELEAHRLEHGPQRATGERAEVRGERMLEPEHEHAPAGGRRGGKREAAAGAQHAADLRERELDVADVLERLDAGDHVEGVVVEGEWCVRLDENELGSRQAR